jgi:hypothetical protein
METVRWSFAVSHLLYLAASINLSGCREPVESRKTSPSIYPYFSTQLDELETNERYASEVRNAFLGTILRPIRTRQWAALDHALSPDFSGTWPSESDWVTTEDPFITTRSSVSPRQSVNARTWKKALISILGSWASIERSEWRVFDSRTSKDESPLIAQRIHLKIAGQIDNTHRGQLHASLSILAQRVEDQWKLKRLDVDEISLTRSALRGFRDVTTSVGFEYILSRADKDNLQGMIDVREMTATGGLTALDFNHDGFWDILASHQAKGSTLFMNDGAGGFTKRRLGILRKDQQSAKFYLWLDLDNDGQEELFSTRPALYRVKQGQLVQQAKALEFQTDPGIQAPNFEGLTACDVNQDGQLDVIASGYSHANSPAGFNNVDSHTGLRNLLFINQGKLRFKEESRSRGIAQTRYSFVAECFDFDNDGDLDLYFGNDYGPNEYYENDGRGYFTSRPDHPLAAGTSFSMGISIADYDNTGDISMSVSNMYSHSGSRIVPFSKGLSKKMMGVLSRLAAGNTLYQIKAPHYRESAAEVGVDLADWAWGNIFFDFDNDGDKDLYVVNGYTTHRDPKAPDF